MAFLSSRRRRARLAPELDDQALGRLLKTLLPTSRGGATGATDLCLAQMSALLEQDPRDWDRRAHRVLVLAGQSVDSRLPEVWASREPGSPHALVVQAATQVARGRLQGRLEDAESVVAACARAAEAAPSDPTPWVVLLDAARLEKWDHTRTFAVWEEVTRRDRWNRAAYLSMLGYLAPEEAGSRFQVLEFLDVLRARMPADAPCVATELTAQVMEYHAVLQRGGVEALMARAFWARKEAALALDRAASTWVQPGFLKHAAALADLNLLAYALMSADRRREARFVLDLVGGTVTPWPWGVEGDPVAVFEEARRRAAMAS